MRIIFCAAIFCLIGCSHNPNKAEKIKTEMDRTEKVSGDLKLGVKDGDMIVQKKTEMREKLRDLQNEVFGLEDKVYGSRKFQSRGLYGDLRTCRSKAASRQYGGSGNLVWAEPLDRVTDKEEELKIGIDEKNQLVGVEEEYLKARLERFMGYKRILQKRQDEFTDGLQDCRTQLSSREFDEQQSRKVSVTEVSKLSLQKEAVSQYMCGYVKPGASLQNLLLNAFGHGWLSVSEFSGDGQVMSPSVRDSNGKEQPNVVMVGGWKLAYDNGSASLQDILGGSKDAKLKAWAANAKCVAKSDGTWNF